MSALFRQASNTVVAIVRAIGLSTFLAEGGWKEYRMIIDMKLGRRGFLKSAALLTVTGTPVAGFADSCTDDATLLNVGLKKQLLFDNLLVESVQDVTREF